MIEVWKKIPDSLRAGLLLIICFLIFSVFVIVNRDLYTYLRYLTLGIPQGAIIALIAVGYSMVYGIIQLINFAHGEVFMFSVYFMIMLLVPITADSTLGMDIISTAVAFMVACTGWVALSNLISHKAARLITVGVLGAVVGTLNWFIIPTTDDPKTLPFLVAVAVALIYSCCLGVTMDLTAYRPLRNSPRLIPLITAIGLSLFFQNTAQAIWGSNRRDFPEATKPQWLMGLSENDNPFIKLATFTGENGQPMVLQTTRLDIAIVVIAIILLIGLQFFIHYSRTGKAMRACAQDRATASLMGIQVNRVVALAFALGAGLAAIAAPLYVLRGTFIAPTMGYIVGILAFSSAVLGGIGNITGAMLGGLVIGIIYTFVPLFDTFDSFKIFTWLEANGIVTKAGWNQLVDSIGRPGQYQLGVAYAFMILIIIFKPTGLLGKASAKRS